MANSIPSRSTWEEFLAPDSHLTTIGHEADQRLAFQAAYPARRLLPTARPEVTATIATRATGSSGPIIGSFIATHPSMSTCGQTPDRREVPAQDTPGGGPGQKSQCQPTSSRPLTRQLPMNLPMTEPPASANSATATTPDAKPATPVGRLGIEPRTGGL
jgi:hypothetical protein